MSDKLCIPEEILNQHAVWLGKTGAGKSSALRHVVEFLLPRKKRVVIIDPKGDWWGLKSSADGKGPGFPLVAFGDFIEQKAQDVPINKHSGKEVGELISTGNRPAMIGFRGWSPEARSQFWVDFAPTLFHANIGELYLVGDEFHNFAPKGKTLDPIAGRCLHWSNRLMSEGRGLGIVCLIASQRPQKVHNDTLTSCETLVAMRVIHAADRAAVKDWIDGAGDKEQGAIVLNSLASMARGEAYVWSPEIGFGPKRLTFPLFRTFDSFAPRQLQKSVSAKGWADVDLQLVKERLSAVIQEHKANDPGELKRQIADLKRELLAAKNATPAPVKVPDPIEVPVLAKGDLEEFKLVAGGIEAALRNVHVGVDNAGRSLKDSLNSFLQKISLFPHAHRAQHVPAIAPKIHVLPTPRRDPVPRTDSPASLGAPSGKLREMMVALAQRPQGLSVKQLAVRTTTSHKGGYFRNQLGAGRSAGWIEGDKALLKITDAGVQALGQWTPLPTGRALLEHWLRELGRESLHSAMLQKLVDVYPGTMSADDLGAGIGKESAGGYFRNCLGKLRSLELVIGSNKAMRASGELFEE